MKNFLLTILMACTFASLCFPQGMTDKGSMSISGGLAYSSSNYKNDNTSSVISVIPSASFFIIRNLEMGLNVRFNYSESEYSIKLPGSSVAEKNISRAFGIGPSFTYYFGEAPVKPFVFTAYSFNLESGILYYTTNSGYDYEFTAEKENYTFHSIFFGAGCLIPLNDKLAITPFVQYVLNRYVKNETEYMVSQTDNDIFSFGAQLKMFL